MTDSVADVKREILVRHLEAWAPAALHRARRATYVHGYADAGPALAQVALRVFVEQSDLVRGRELTMVAVGEDVTGVGAGLAAGRREAGAAAGRTVHAVPGGPDARLAVALRPVGAGGDRLLAFLDAIAARDRRGADRREARGGGDRGPRGRLPGRRLPRGAARRGVPAGGGGGAGGRRGARAGAGARHAVGEKSGGLQGRPVGGRRVRRG